jgi:hypothetical protein
MPAFPVDSRDCSGVLVERQVTSGPSGHVLTNVNAWSADGASLVYDDRRDDHFRGTRIARVNVNTGETELLYESRHGANCGVASYRPAAPQVIFMQGPERPTAEWSYGFTRRHGMLVDTGKPGVARHFDAMNYAPPFTPGALRGGSHLHVFSPDGAWVSFTYEDDVLARLGEHRPGWDVNQRNIGVAVPAGPVVISPGHPRNHNGDFFSVLVSRTAAVPRPGSDEISRAFEEAWIGSNGYLRLDGARQSKAIAFQGVVTAQNGRQHAEVFVLDLPGDLTAPGDDPLEGSAARAPAPPLGTIQRRVTFTGQREFPGIASTPRHWLRSSPDGAEIAFLLQDDIGLAQLWSISPNGGEPRQISRHSWGVASAFTWSPDGRWIAHVTDHSVCLTEVATGRLIRLTRRSEVGAAPLPYACVFSPKGDRIAYMRNIPDAGKVWTQIFVTTVPC